jgi:trk system potassium uptake protein TrkH
MRLSLVVHTIGILVRLFGATFAAPLFVAVLYREWIDALGFVGVGTASLALGTVMRRAGGVTGPIFERGIRRVEGLAIVGGLWLVLANLAAIPYMWSGFGFVDSLFESMSGLTATGATVIADFSRFGRAVFVWRSLTMWLGGLGVIALFVAVLPRLAVGGRELFFAEAPGPTDEKLTPQLRQTALALWKLYTLLTVAMIAALALAGMPLLDAVSNSLSTIAAGGFSPNPLSIGGYENPAIEWIVALFMFIAGANFALQYRAVRGSHASLMRDEELRAYAGIILVAAVAVAVFLMQDGMAFGEAARHGLFQVISITTTTGFASVDYQLWNDQAKMVLLLLMFIGGCAGSAAGGPKVVRHLLMARYTLRELKRTLHPQAILPVKLGGRVVPEAVLRNVQVFMLFYLLTFAAGAAIVVGFGADLVTGITATIACLSNVGPGFEMVGPMTTYAGLHPVSKIVLTLEMWIGRLEVLTVLVFFRLEVWRAARWRA